MIKVLFVCLGNICRSPAAEGYFKHAARLRGLDLHVAADSAAIGGWHVGDPPDPRAVSAADRRGVYIDALRARRVTPSDAANFDYIVAMDCRILSDLKARLRTTEKTQVRLLLDFAGPPKGREVPDPYLGTDADFERMLDLIEEGVDGLLTVIEKSLDAC